jgi:hypothetical protein
MTPPARNLERGTKDLGADEFCHVDGGVKGGVGILVEDGTAAFV